MGLLRRMVIASWFGLKLLTYWYPVHPRVASGQISLGTLLSVGVCDEQVRMIV